MTQKKVDSQEKGESSSTWEAEHMNITDEVIVDKVTSAIIDSK